LPAAGGVARAVSVGQPSSSPLRRGKRSALAWVQFLLALPFCVASSLVLCVLAQLFAVSSVTEVNADSVEEVRPLPLFCDFVCGTSTAEQLHEERLAGATVCLLATRVWNQHQITGVKRT